jgi:hypothetical protein
MSFGKASASPGLMTTQKAGALTQQIAKDEGCVTCRASLAALAVPVAL